MADWLSTDRCLVRLHLSDGSSHYVLSRGRPKIMGYYLAKTFHEMIDEYGYIGNDTEDPHNFSTIQALLNRGYYNEDIKVIKKVELELIK